MADPRIPLKNPYLAAALAFLIPGAGHLYQGRTFKGVLYGVCIIGTFTYGMFLSDWTALYAGSPLSSSGRRWGFVAQMPLGTPAMFALVQQRRYASSSNVPQKWLDGPISAPFQGVMGFDRPEGIEQSEIAGRIELEPVMTSFGSDVEGKFTGHVLKPNPKTKQLEEAGPVELHLKYAFEIDRKIYADPDRLLGVDIVEKTSGGKEKTVGRIQGTIPRSLANRLGVPLEQDRLEQLHSEYGKVYDLALVYTWIASLLNVLVIWDAFEGPAYGYGDEQPEGEAEASKSGKQEAEGDGPPKVKSEKHPAASAG